MGKMRRIVLKFLVLVVVMLVGVAVFAAPFSDNFFEENTNSTLFSQDIDINKYGNNLQRRNIQVKSVDYNSFRRAEQIRRTSIVNGVESVAKTSSQVALQNNTWNGYTHTGVNITTAQNVTFNRPMTVDAYAGRTSVTDAFVDNNIVSTESMQYVPEDGTYGDGAQPGPITDTIWGFLFFVLGYVVVRRFC